MSPAGQVLLVVGVLAVLHVPLGNYLARVYTASAHGRVEMLIFRLGRIDPDADQRWPVYLTSLLAFSAVGVGALYLLLRLQGHLPYFPRPPDPSRQAQSPRLPLQAQDDHYHLPHRGQASAASNPHDLARSRFVLVDSVAGSISQPSADAATAGSP